MPEQIGRKLNDKLEKYLPISQFTKAVEEPCFLGGLLLVPRWVAHRQGFLPSDTEEEQAFSGRRAEGGISRVWRLAKSLVLVFGWDIVFF